LPVFIPYYAFLVGVVPNLPCLINSVNPNIDVGSGIYLYDFGWLLGFFATGLVYVVLSYISRPETIGLSGPFVSRKSTLQSAKRVRRWSMDVGRRVP
jgi:hypothetical protein